MRRKLITFIGLASPLLLFFICAVTITLVGFIGWWLFSQEGGSRIIRIVSLPPLSTPQAAQSLEEISARADALLAR